MSDNKDNSKLTEYERSLISKSIIESLDRIHTPKDKFIREENKREQEEFNYNQDKGAMFLKNMHTFFLENMKLLKLNNTEPEFVTKLLFMFVSFMLTEITLTSHMKDKIPKQLDYIASVGTNSIITLKMTLALCHPTIQDTFKETFPILCKTLLNDSHSDSQYHSVDVLHSIIREFDQQGKHITPDQTKFYNKYWKDDVYGKGNEN